MLTCYSKLSNNESIIISDKTKINQVLSNLIKNAIKFTQKGEISFGCSREKDAIQFFVKDTGIGVTPDLKDKIFERFIQGDMSIDRHYEGAGLGLSISKAYVEKLGGKIWLESELGKGSTFYFTIPFISPSDQKQSESFQDNSLKYNNITILLAEDDEISQLFVAEMLEPKGVTVLKAYNGKDAVELARKNPDIDIVLMDIKMPVMDGCKATTLIKKENPDIPIIAQTAYAMDKDKDKALKAGCDYYIVKPINVDLLFEMLNLCLSKTRFRSKR